ncbi:hypothetical protein JQK62_26635, partial [Leptospira santarosai]|nr:hypothetical protein [Leptospira santarosai]
MAIEEYALKTMDVDKDSFFLFYINEPAIIIGKNQNTIEATFVKGNRILFIQAAHPISFEP